MNPVFALTIRMKNCRRMLISTAIFYVLAITGIFMVTLLYSSHGVFTQAEYFEIGFLAVTCCSIVFLGCDFGCVFIEATFQDELFRLTPLTPLNIVHGGILSSLFFSFLLLCLAFPFLIAAHVLGFAVERAFWATLLFFVFGQAMNLVLLSYYIQAKSWRQIGFGAATALCMILALPTFCFTEFGNQLLHENTWPAPMLFLYVVSLGMWGLAYFLAQNHAKSRRRSFRTNVFLNLSLYGLYFAIATMIALHR